MSNVNRCILSSEAGLERKVGADVNLRAYRHSVSSLQIMRWTGFVWVEDLNSLANTAAET